jgi:hypothetical protein
MSAVLPWFVACARRFVFCRHYTTPATGEEMWRPTQTGPIFQSTINGPSVAYFVADVWPASVAKRTICLSQIPALSEGFVAGWRPGRRAMMVVFRSFALRRLLANEPPMATFFGAIAASRRSTAGPHFALCHTSPGIDSFRPYFGGMVELKARKVV